ncbi:MAG TPA: NAD-dependent epimerase/dehydratase family protein [Deltaproteobacteria bacterium]|nr:NAD-dependent epimerase/dehydratase family protein [Deltaproteobacteria bacterium]
MRVLVMGGTQFNGLALVHELARTGHDVVILNRGQSQADLPMGIERLFADRTDETRMRDVLSGVDVDAIIDVSAYRPEDVELMIDLFRGRVAHYIFISSTVIYAASDLLPITENHPVERGPAQNEYGQNKLLCEDILIREWRENRFPASIVAFSMVMGAHNILPDREQRMFQRILQGRPILVPGNGRMLQQVGHADDQARALRMLLGEPRSFGERYNLTGGDFFSQEGYVDTFARVLEREVEKVFIPPALMEALWQGRIGIELPKAQAKVDIRSRARISPVMINRFMLSMLVQQIAPHLHHWDRSALFSIDKLRRHCGWEPEMDFPRTVERTWRWYRSEGLAESQTFDFDFEDDLIARARDWKP